MTRLLHLPESLLRFVLRWAYLGLVSLCFLPVFLVLFPSRRRRILASNLYGRLVGRVMIFLQGGSLPPGLRARVGAIQPAIYVSNHTSYTDIFLGVWSAPSGTLATAKRGVVIVPFFGQLYALSGNVLINRANKRDAAAALRETIELMQRHRLSVWLWPEGTRSASGRLLPFKRGFAHVALATRLPIVPVVVTGAHRCWPCRSPLTYRTALGVQVLDPIPTTHWTLENLDRHVAEVHARFVAALPPDQQPATPLGSNTNRD